VDGVRQQFTEKERDVETGLGYFGAKYLASSQGRFTSPDVSVLPRKVRIENFLTAFLQLQAQAPMADIDMDEGCLSCGKLVFFNETRCERGLTFG